MNRDPYVELQGNAADPVLLLHGLGCNGAVWDPLVALLLKHGFGTIVPDFGGHGRSAWSPSYSIEQQAAAVAAVVPRGRAVKVIGHSMGATVGLLLASGRFGIDVSSLFAVGLKIDWSQEEMDRMGELRPMRRFAARSEAAQRFLRVTGLAGLIEEEHRCVQAGLVEEADGFRLATDPKTVCVVHEPVAPLLASAQALGLPLRLSCGSEDRLLDIASLRKWDNDAVVFQGYGHNVHVAVQVLLESFLEHGAATLSRAGDWRAS
jgi:pimeloyl-ACP methyl ester carboxylesterase